MKKKITAAIVIGGFLVAGIAYANYGDPRGHEVTDYMPGHTHAADGITINAPQHSGGTNKNGCHNKSVPYHCH